MEKLNRENINTRDYWNQKYSNSERGGWLCSGWIYNGVIVQSDLDKFLYPQINLLLSKCSNIKCIEIGGGDGYGPNLLSKKFPELEIWNIELSDVAVIRGKEKYPHINHIYHDILTPLNLNFMFDILICQEVIEHLDNISLGIKNMMDLLKSEGFALFTFPLNEHYFGAIEHVWSLDYNGAAQLFFPYTNAITFCKFTPIGGNLHGCVYFDKS